MTGIHLEKRLIGYARVSTYGQTLDARRDQFRAVRCIRAVRCNSRNIYREKKVTGARGPTVASFSGCSTGSPPVPNVDRDRGGRWGRERITIGRRLMQGRRSEILSALARGCAKTTWRV